MPRRGKGSKRSRPLGWWTLAHVLNASTDEIRRELEKSVPVSKVKTYG
jgi:hypothetical protein